MLYLEGIWLELALERPLSALLPLNPVSFETSIRDWVYVMWPPIVPVWCTCAGDCTVVVT